MNNIFRKASSVAAAAPASAEKPVRSLVYVYFPDDGRTFPYYNDAYDLREGDLVLVSGKLEGLRGVVEKVCTKFSIHTADYEKVTQKIALAMNGRYGRKDGWMISRDESALSPEQMRLWLKPARKNTKIVPVENSNGKNGGWVCVEEEDEVVCGEGFSAKLRDLESCDDLEKVILGRGRDYFRNGHVKYVSVKNGRGAAFVRGGSWYELSFELSGDEVSEIYCDCPYPGMCKHEAALLLALEDLEKNDVSLSDCTAISRDFFWTLVETTHQEIAL